MIAMTTLVAMVSVMTDSTRLCVCVTRDTRGGSVLKTLMSAQVTLVKIGENAASSSVAMCVFAHKEQVVSFSFCLFVFFVV